MGKKKSRERKPENKSKKEQKTLIAFETKSGATEESALKIAEVLRSKFQLEVDLANLKKQSISDYTQYGNIVIGGGVRGGKVYRKALKFLENGFNGKKELKKLLFRGMIETDERGFGLAFGLVIINVQNQGITRLFFTHGFHHHRRQQDFIAHRPGQQQNPILFYFKQLAFKIADHGILLVGRFWAVWCSGPPGISLRHRPMRASPRASEA